MPRKTNPLSKRNETRTFSLSGAELARLVEREAVRLGASKRAKVVREKGEFDARQLQSFMRAPLVSGGGGSWSIEEIVSARDAQMSGRFRMAARLAESMGTDDALFTARGVRLAPVQSLGVELSAAPKGKGDKIADEATALFGLNGIAIGSDTITTIRSHLADHGVAFGCISWTPRADGSRVDPILNAWPIEFVWWHAVAQCYVTQVRYLDCDPDPKPGDRAGKKAHETVLTIDVLPSDVAKAMEQVEGDSASTVVVVPGDPLMAWWTEKVTRSPDTDVTVPMKASGASARRCE